MTMKTIIKATIFWYILYVVWAKKKGGDDYHEPGAVDERASICYVNIRKLDDDHPIMIHPNTSDIVYPNRPFLHIYMASKQRVELHCPGQHLYLGETLYKTFATVSCVGGLIFDDDNALYNIEDVKCTGMVKSTVIRTGTACYPTGEYLQIGFQLSDGRFLNQYTVCFDYERRTTYSTYNVVSEWANWSNLTANTNYWEGTFFNCSLKVRTVFNMDVQRESYGYLSGMIANASRFINQNQHLRKHKIVPPDDFVYKFERVSTNWYLNIVPLWSHLKLFNWLTVQRIIRRYASTRRINLEVYSGTLSTMEIYNSHTGQYREFFLPAQGPCIPVPLYIWKVVYDPKRKSGVAIIGLNNVHYRNKPDLSQFCTDISKELGPSFPIGNTRQYNYENGYLFACTIEEFRKHAPFIPDFEVTRMFEPI